MSKYKELYEIVKKSNRFVLFSHIHSDGDAIGSVCAFYQSLAGRSKDVTALIPGKIPEKYHFLDTKSMINILSEEESLKKIESADVIIILDISSTKRLGRWYEAVIKSPAIKIAIDHHPLNPQGMDFSIVNTDKIATA